MKDFFKKALRDLLHSNINVHSRRLISEFPGYGVKCISKTQSHRANVTFSDKSRYARLIHKVTQKGGESTMNYISIYSKMNRPCHFH